MYLLAASFLGGILTVFTPCVFLLLPIILTGNIAEIKIKNQILTILSLIFFILLTTILLKFSSLFLSVNERFWTNLSASLIIFLGASYIFPNLWANKFFGNWFSKIGKKVNVSAFQFSTSSKLRPILIGFALTPIFASCSPIYFLLLASVLPVNFSLGLVYIFAYCIGIGITLFTIANIGQKLLLNLNKKIVENMKFKILVGVVFVFTGLLIFFGLDKKLEVNLTTPELVKKIDEKILDNTNLIVEKKEIMKSEAKRNSEIVHENFGNAPELIGITDYINIEPNTKLYDILKKNKVVLFEFWTYSCVNCKRTMPYLNSWYEKYHNKGFEIVGVHTPEFAFEKVKENVVKKSQEQGIKFPIFMDNNFATWNAYNNRYWPMRFLILPTGQIIYQHAGEGDYQNNENLIRYIVENN